MSYFWGNLIFYLPFIILAAAAIYAQLNVKSTFNKYSGVVNSRGYTGADVARMLLDQAGITDVSVEYINGSLNDHYDSVNKVIRLSSSVYDSRSVAALGVAAHETGHAIQHSEGYLPREIKSSLAPVYSFGSQAAIPMVFIGLFIGYFVHSLFLAYAGIILFTIVTAYQVITLPVEFDASHRAMKLLTENAFLSKQEAAGARKVLTAAALTYLAAAATAILNLLRLWMMINGGRRRDR